MGQPATGRQRFLAGQPTVEDGIDQVLAQLSDGALTLQELLLQVLHT